MSNNAAERAVRDIAVGRRNWTFYGSDTGGQLLFKDRAQRRLAGDQCRLFLDEPRQRRDIGTRRNVRCARSCHGSTLADLLMVEHRARRQQLKFIYSTLRYLSARCGFKCFKSSPSSSHKNCSSVSVTTGGRTTVPSFAAIDHHVAERVRGFLTRRHKVAGRGAAEFSDKTIFGDLGVVRLLRYGNKNQPWALP
jgi:Transposase IS66 family